MESADARKDKIISQLRELLDLTNVTQKDLAQSLGIKPSHINLFFKGKSDIHSAKLIVILACLGIDLEEIIKNRIDEIQGSDSKVDSAAIYSKIAHLKDYNREPLLKIIKVLVG